MNKFEFLEKAMLLAVGLGTEDLPTVLARAEEAYTLLNPPPPPKPPKRPVVDDEEKILGVLRDGPVNAVGGAMSLRVRDVLLQAIRRDQAGRREDSPAVDHCHEPQAEANGGALSRREKMHRGELKTHAALDGYSGTR